MHRYVWEGRLVAAGINPYRVAPDDPSLRDRRDANWQGINHKDMPGLYPPLMQGVFAALAAVRPSPLFFKAAFIAFDVAAFLLLLALLRPWGSGMRDRISGIYFLNPLLLLEVAGHGHFESLLLLSLIAFLAALAKGRLGWAALFLFCGASIKLVALALAPLLILRAREGGPLLGTARAWILAAALPAALAAELWLSGALEGLRSYAADYRYNSAVPWLVNAVTGPFLGPADQRLLAGLLFGMAVLTALWRLRAAPAERQGLALMGLVLLFSPTLHPWYLLWILPFAALCRSRPWLLFTGTVAVTYAVNLDHLRTGKWREIPWLRLPEFLPPLLQWLIPKLRSARASG